MDQILNASLQQDLNPQSPAQNMDEWTVFNTPRQKPWYIDVEDEGIESGTSPPTKN
ncbi:MAG TPA: hypothetical protein PKW15_07980 [Alphaproteobacteria bacterium]|nr:hypothetical protein [Alphaproteobacteria bacterium]